MSNWAAILGLPTQLPEWSWWLILPIGIAVAVVLLAIFRAGLWLAFLCVPLYIAAVMLWPTAWIFHVVFWPLIIMALIVIFLARRWWVGKVLGGIMALLMALAIAIGIAGPAAAATPPNPDNPASNAVCVTTSIPSSTAVDFQTLKKPKEVVHAFGPNANKGSIPADADEFCARLTVDPSLVAGVKGAFGMLPQTAQAAQADEVKLLADRNYWKQSVDQIMAALRGAKQVYTTEVKKGSHSLYMVPTSDNSFVNFGQGNTSHDGTALVIVKADGSTVMLRLDCGFQPIFATPPTGYPECGPSNCPTPPTPPDCVSTYGPGWTGGWNSQLHKLVCKDPASDDVSQNKAVAPWKTDGPDRHSVSDGDGAVVSNGYQADPAADAAAAKAKADAEAAAAKKAHDDAVAAATVASENGSPTPDESHTAAPTPGPDW